jgi:hypothetical protein
MDAWTPPFCPNPGCKYHCGGTTWKWILFGTFARKHCLPAEIQRYRCLHCKRTFSTQTFDTSYWLHKPSYLPQIFLRIQACSCLRQIAFEYKLSPSTLQRHISRLGRHCLLYQHQHQPAIMEPLVLDGFESFEYSQFCPFHFNVLVGKNTHFFYQFTEAPLRRKGSMTPAQKRKRKKLEEKLGRPDPKAIEKNVAELLRLATKGVGRIELYSDDHPAYPRAFKSLPDLKIEHHVTSGKARRTTRNPLFPVNLLDLLIRHGGSNHKRETIAFSKRRQAAIERQAAMQVWRNFMRPFSVKKRDRTPAQRAGVRETVLSLGELLKQRIFATQVKLPESLDKYYRRQVVTPALGVNLDHRLKYAF